MNELEFQEEWLSAYLDDELTAEQRQVVEQRLAIDPAAQAMLEDLRRVRTMIAKLPTWAGPNLEFTIPAELPGTFDEAEDALENTGEDDDTTTYFEEVPRLLARVEEPRGAASAHASWNLQSRVSRAMLGWIATAASVLLVAGLAYVYWPSTGLQVAHVDSKQAPGTEGRDLSLGRSGTNSLGDEVLLGATAMTSPTGGEARDLAENLSLAKQLSSALPTVAMSAESTRNSEMEIQPESADKKDLKTKSADAMPTSGNASGRFGGRSESAPEFAFNRKETAAARGADLPAPAPMNASRGRAQPEAIRLNEQVANSPSHEDSRGLFKADASAVYFARSQSWMDDEAQTLLTYGGANQYSANQLAFGNNALQAGADQKPGVVPTESVLMAAIKPEIANSADFFEKVITSNQLIAVDQQQLLRQLSTADRSLTADSAVADKPAASDAVAAPATSAASAFSFEQFSTQRIQMAVPYAPLGNSFVLFVNRYEANRILNQLQEKGQVTSQVWRIVKQPEAQASGIGLNVPAAAEPQNVIDARISGELQNKKAEMTGKERVILMLNGPPN